MDCLLCGKEIGYFGICIECADKCDYEMTDEEKLAINETITHRAMVTMVDEAMSYEEEHCLTVPRPCAECNGTGEDKSDHECIICDGTGTITIDY